MTDPAAGLSVMHVIVRAGATNSQFNEHCLPTAAERDVTVCSLFPADVTPPPEITLFEGEGSSARQCFRTLRRALEYRPYDVVHVHAPASGVLTLLAYAWTRRSRHNLVFTVHNSWQNFRRRNRLFLRLILALFPTIVVCGQAAHDSMPTRLRNRRAHKLSVVPNGVDVDRIDRALEAAPEGLSPGPDSSGRRGLTVVSVNRLIKLKNPDTMIDAFHAARHPDDHLVMVGDGPLRRRMEQRVRRLGLEGQVSFLGLIPRDEVFRVLARADVLVTTSGGEGLPVALLEAMACRCPAVVTDIPPHREIARLTGAVPLVPVRDVQGFARSIRRARDLGPERRELVGAQLRACVVEQFSVQVMNHSYGELYARVATSAPGAHREVSADTPLLTKLRRRLGLVTALTVLGALAGLVYAQYQPAVYTAETTLRVGAYAGYQADEETMKSSAAQATAYADLVRREPILRPVAEQGFAPTWRLLVPEVEAETGDVSPQLVRISVHASSAEEARALATAVGRELVSWTERERSSSQRAFVRQQISDLQRDIEQTRRQLAQARAELRSTTDDAEVPALRTRVSDLGSALADLQASYVDLQGLQGAATGRLTWVDRPWAATSPLQPVPLLLGFAGAAFGLTLATAWVHLRSRGRMAPTPVQPHRPLPGGNKNGHDGRARGPARRPVVSRTWAGPDRPRRTPLSTKENERS